ncbi:hypothetical protein EMPG_10342 [Blastomyces silverae]|uniref:FHA domain-containing protein n=1 Tax=Blastomyces silverae TaxID=2060906 RepID=A0A0H1B5F6_9EURO|nr:hypothetical protein EMPG_10342 [Blastomyces silverae]
MDNRLEFPPWSLREVTLVIVCHDDQAFLRANPSAVHPYLTPHDTWYSGVNPDNEVQAPSNPSQADTDIPGTHPAVLLLRELPRNGGAYIFGRESPLEPDVKFPQSCISKRHLCVYPDLTRRTWIIQALSPLGAKVNGCRIGSEGVGIPSRRALQYDCLNRVVIAENEFSPGVIFYVKPVWPSDSNYIHWSWQDPNLPELAALNLSWTRTAPALSQSEILWPGQADALRFCLLERRLCNGIELFYAQDLEAGTMLLAEKFLSEREAREQLSWRIRLKASDEMLEFEQRDDRTTYALFECILSTLHSLFSNGVAGVAITSSNILVEDLHPGSPQFWLTGVSSARPLPENEIEESHSADVKAVMRIFTEDRESQNYFQHPVANSFFAEFLDASKSGALSAQRILDKFASATQADADHRFKQCYLTAKVAVERVQSNGQTYYQKAGVARVASALFSETADGSQEAYTKVLSTRSRYRISGYEEYQLLHREEVHKMFERLGRSPAYDFGAHERKQKPRRTGNREEADRGMQEICLKMPISSHAPSNMWNILQLINAIRPAHSLDIGDPEFAVEVGGDANCEGFYVDFNYFENACRLLHVIPPAKFPESPDDDSPAKSFRSACNQEDNIVVADKKLLGAAVLKRSSRSMYHCGTEFSETEILDQFPRVTFEGLHRAIFRFNCPPYDLRLLCQEQPEEALPESQCVNMTESHSSRPPSFSILRARRIAGRPRSKARVAEWVSEQATRRRRSRGE